MTLPPHVRLANEIAVQFTHVPREEAVAAIAKHIRSFWDRACAGCCSTTSTPAVRTSTLWRPRRRSSCDSRPEWVPDRAVVAR